LERKQRQSFDGGKHSSRTATNQPPPIHGINHSSTTPDPTPPMKFGLLLFSFAIIKKYEKEL
jgi:hypothetical protein